MDNEENKYKKKININSKLIIKVGSLLTIILLIFVSTVAQIGFDSKEFSFSDWASKTIIMIIISLFGMFMGESIGDDKQKSTINGLYQTSLSEYNQTLKSISLISLYFNDFMLWYKENETRAKQLSYLMSFEIKDAKEVLDNVRISDLKTLLERPIKYENNVIIRQKTQEQIEAIENVLRGKITIKANEPTYYLNAFGEEQSSSELEVGKQLSKSIRHNKTFNRAFKIGTSLVVSIIWSTSTISEFLVASDPSAWVNLITRISTLFTCLYSGFKTSIIDVQLQSRVLQNKTSILNKFKMSYEKKEFVPVNYKDLAREEYEKYEKEALIVKENNEEMEIITNDIENSKV